MSSTTSDGSMMVVSADIHQDKGFTQETGLNGKFIFKCIHCDYSIHTEKKQAIRRHITTKHASKPGVATESPNT